MGAKRKKKQTPKSTVEALPTGSEAHHHPRLGDVLGSAVGGAAADAELEPDDEPSEDHDAKGEEP